MNRYNQIIVAIFIMFLPAMANAANRVALVIGNDNYLHISTLHTAVADARAMGKALNEVGYDVNYQHDLNRIQLFKAVRNFKSSLKQGDEVVFYYAGHGVAINGVENYLLPVDVPNGNADQVRDGSLALQRVLDDLRVKKVRLSMVIVDACRNNPFTNIRAGHRSFGTRGLVRERTAEGQMVIYSAGDGQEALDNLGTHDPDPNGVFTRVFLKEMKKPGLNISDVVRNVRKKVAALAKSIGEKQVPAVYDQVIGDFYFVPANEKKKLDDREKLKLQIAQLEHQLAQQSLRQLPLNKNSERLNAAEHAKITSLERLARNAISKTHYSKPKGKSALDYIEKIRAISPDSLLVKNLASIVISKYISLAKRPVQTRTIDSIDNFEQARKIAVKYELTKKNTVQFKTLSKLYKGTKVNMSYVTKVRKNCDDGSTLFKWHKGNTQYVTFVFYGDSSVPWIFGYKSGKIEIYDPKNILEIGEGFTFRSSVKPKNINKVVAVQANKGIKLTNVAKTNDFAQIAFRNSRKYGHILQLSKTASSKNVAGWLLPNGDYDSAYIVDKSGFNSNVISKWGCFNVEVE